MQLSRYLHEGIWAFLDKSLPLIYGVFFIFLVIRTLPEEEYGLFVLTYNVIFITLTLISKTLILQPMIKYVSEKDDTKAVVTQTIFLNFATLAIFVLIVIPSSPILARLFHSSRLVPLLKFVPFLLAAHFMKDITLGLLTAKYRMKEVFCLDAVYFFGSALLMLIYNLMGRMDRAQDVLTITCFAALAASITGTFLSRDLLRLNWKIDFNTIRTILNFGKYTLGSGVGNILYTQTDTFMIGYFYGPIPVASYNAAKFFFKIYNVFSQAISMLVFPLSSRLHAEHRMDEIKALFEKMVCFYYIILIPFNLVMLVLSKEIFEIAYAGRYSDSAKIFIVLVIGTFLIPLGTVGSNIILGVEKPKISFRITWVTIASNVILNLLFIPKYGALGAAVATIFSMGIGAILTAAFAKRITGAAFTGVLLRVKDVANFGREILENVQKSFSEQRS